jgi:hypothetical protein
VITVKKESVDKIKSFDDITENDIKYKEQYEFCEHLSFDKKGFFCNVHHYDWFKETPCFQFSQIEDDENQVCRIGDWYKHDPNGIFYHQTNIMEKWRKKNEA